MKTKAVFFDKDGTKGRVDLRPATLENYLSIVKKYEKHAILELKSDFRREEIGEIIDIIFFILSLLNLRIPASILRYHNERSCRIEALFPARLARYYFILPLNNC